MVGVEVWAPNAEIVEALVNNQRLPLTKLEPEAGRSGFWTIDLPAGTDYLLSVDGNQGFPDPKSRHQPDGVHGPSRVVDLGFEWTDDGWHGRPMLGEVWYELHIGTFTDQGTFDSAIARFPHLKELGVAVIEVMPVAGFPGDRGWGYDGVDLFAVHQAYGGPAAFQRFIDAAHAHGMAVALDVVYNHLGPSGNYLSQFGPYFTSRHHTPWGEAVNLDDEDASTVREFLLDNAKQWFFDYHLDALRLDAIHAFRDDSDFHFLAELAQRKDEWQAELGRPLALVAESDLNDVKLLEPRSKGGFGLDAQWDDDFHHALHAFITGEKFGYYVDFGAPEVLADVLSNVFLHRGGWSTFREQDWGRAVPRDMNRDRFVVFNQNHDQVGNRALGDRPDRRLTPGQVMASAALMLLSPFTPLLFQGQEWGTDKPFLFFTDHGEDIGPGIQEGRAKEFGGHGWEELYGANFDVPDPQSRNTFEASKLDWETLQNEDPSDTHLQILSGYQALISLREMVAGDQHVASDFGDGWFTMHRSRLSVIAHVADHASTHRNVDQILWSFGDAKIERENGQNHLLLGPHSVAVITRLQGETLL